MIPTRIPTRIPKIFSVLVHLSYVEIVQRSDVREHLFEGRASAWRYGWRGGQ